VWQTRSWLAPLDDRETQPDWANADTQDDPKESLDTHGAPNATYAEAPAALLRSQNYAAWRKDLQAHIYEHSTMTVFRSPLAGLSSVPGGSDEGEFRSRLSLALRERRDEEIERLRKKYAPRLTTLEDQVRRAGERIERERSQLSQQKMQTAISVGTSILGALLGRKRLSVGNAQRIGSAARSVGRIGRESEDVGLAEDSREVLQQRLGDLQNDLEQEVSRLKGEYDPASAQVDRAPLRPRKSDIEVTTLALAWVDG
jgi:hypothetical protein